MGMIRADWVPDTIRKPTKKTAIDFGCLFLSKSGILGGVRHFILENSQNKLY
jgi:hypothetical protein